MTQPDKSLHDLLRPFLSARRSGLITDVDGTISPIAPTPDAAFVTPRSRDALRRLSDHLALVAVISGRAVDDVRERVGLPELTYIGNHGLERWHAGSIEVLPEAAAYRPALEQVIAAVQPLLRPGMLLEDKRVTLSIHYRLADDPDATAVELAPAVERITRENGLAFVPGRMIFEVRPPLKIDKGSAFERLIRDHALDAALYIGDDTTDADALKMARTLRASSEIYSLGVGVESDETPLEVADNADWLVSGVSGVELFLEAILSAASASSS